MANFTPVTVMQPWFNRSTVVSSGAVTLWFTTTTAICLFGTVSTLLLLLVILSKKSLRSGAGMLIFYLLCVELFQCSFMSVFKASVSFAAHQGYVVTVHCPTLQFFYIVTLQTRHWTELFLAINRFVATIFPYQYKSWTTHRVINSMMLMSVLIPAMCNFPFYATSNPAFGSVPPVGNCGIRQSASSYIQVSSVIGTYAPLVLMGIIYVTLFVTINCRQRCLKKTNETTNSMSAKRRIKRRLAVAKILFMAYLWYLVCFMPIPLIGTLERTVFKKYPFLVLWLVTGVVCGNVATPIFCSAMDSDYRNGIRKLLCTSKLFSFPQLETVAKKTFTEKSNTLTTDSITQERLYVFLGTWESQLASELTLSTSRPVSVSRRT